MPLLDQPRTFNLSLELVPFALCYFYVSGTENPTPAYAGATVRQDPENPGEFLYEVFTEHPNPMQSDAAARLDPIWLDPEVQHRMVMTTAAGDVLHDIDPFQTFPGPDQITPYTDDGELMPFATLTIYRSQTTALDTLAEADELGVFAPIILDPLFVYRVILKNQAGELIYDVDPIPGNGALYAGGGGCVCDPHALVVFDANGNRLRWSYVDAVAWNCFAPGTYQVQFTPTRFTRAPIVVASPVHDDNPEPGPRVHVEIGEVSATSAMIHVTNLDTGDPIDRGVHVNAWEPLQIATSD